MAAAGVPKHSENWLSRASSGGLAAVCQTVLLAVLLCWMLFSWAQVGWLVRRDYVDLPIWDYWRVVRLFPQYQAGHLSALWEQHNEHRIVFPEIVFAVDMLLLHGRQILPLVLSVLFYWGCWFVLCGVVLPIRREHRFPLAAAAFTAGIIFGSQASAQLLNTPFLLQWTLVQLSSLLAFFFLSKLPEHPSTRNLVGCVACCIVANYSSGNGLLLWPIVLVGALALGVVRRHQAILAATAALSIGLYFVGYHSSKDAHPLLILQHPGYALGFLGTYLAMPFERDTPAAGLASLALFFLLGLLAWRQRVWRATPVVIYCGSYLFTVATVIITMSGRMNPDDPTYIAATAPRYVTVPLVNWAVLLLFAAWMSVHLRWKALNSWVLCGAALFLVLSSRDRVHNWAATVELGVMEQQAATLSLESGVFAPELVRKVYPDANTVALYLPTLQNSHLAVFSETPSDWIGKDTNTIFEAGDKDFATGAVEDVSPLSAGIEVSGWVDSRHNYRRIALVDDRGRVVGLGMRLSAGVPPNLRPAGKKARFAWVGFIDQRFPSAHYKAFLLSDGNKPQAAPFGQPFAPPTVFLGDPGSAGKPLPLVSWSLQPGWSDNLLPPGIDTGTAYSGEFIASWSGNDSKTGVARSSLFATQNHCLILPVLRGPTAGHLHLQVLDRDDRAIADVPLRGVYSEWQLFRIPLQAPQVRLQAEDAGRAWGEWLAVGKPLACSTAERGAIQEPSRSGKAEEK